MDATLIRYIMMSLDYFAALILTLILICCALEKNKTLLLKLYIGMVVACTAALLLEALSLTVAFVGLPNGNILRALFNNVSIVFGYGLAFFYACYVANLVGPNRKVCRQVINLLKVTGVAAVAFLTVGSFMGMFYTIQDIGITAGKFFGLAFAYDVIACLAGILLIAVYKKALNRRDIIALMCLPVGIFLSAVLQFSFFEMMYGLFLMAAFSAFIIYLMIQTDRNRRTIEQEKQLVDMNISLMLSQIQPHFLYNSLSSIRRMITKDPKVAVEAVENFSTYLRQNLESMNRVEPISFETELNHVQEYLYLEKLRFGERLQVEYDIGFSDFSLPVLTLQPIVENAVKHGVLRKEEGGTVWLSTRRESTTVVLTVADNGIGFIPETADPDGGVHIGLTNVERRINMQCNGTVQVRSKPGEGTTVTITIPLM